MDNKGVALFITLFVFIIMSILAMIFIDRSMPAALHARRYAASTQAFWLADAGIQQAFWELNRNNCQGFLHNGTPCASCDSCDSGTKQLSGTLGSNGDFDVAWEEGDALGVVYVLTATGSFPSRNSSRKLTRRIEVIKKASADSYPLDYAVFGKERVLLSNNILVDSYNSTSADYGDDFVDENGNEVENINSNGDVGSNGSITINNNAEINGDVVWGLNGVEPELGNNVELNGEQIHASEDISIPSVIVPTELVGLSGSSSLTISNNETVTLPAGDYKYSEIIMANNTQLKINGKTRIYLTNPTQAMNFGKNNVTITIADQNEASLRIYCDGVFSIMNNVTVNNVTKSPANFMIFSTYFGEEGMLIKNNSDFYGVIYAPDTNVEIGNNGDDYGSFIGKSIDFKNNASIHYDEYLGNGGGSGFGNLSLIWKEI